MSSTPLPDGNRANQEPASPPGASPRLALIVLAWAIVSVVLYAALRSGDVQRVFGSVGARVLDLTVALVAIIAYLPAADRVASFLVPGAHALDRHLARIALALGAAIGWPIVLGVTGTLGPIALLVGPALALGWGRTHVRTVFRDMIADLPALGRELRSFPGALVVAILLASLTLSLTPAVSQDALVYHLTVPQLWLAEGGFVDLPGNVYSRFPMHTEMLYLTGLAWRGEVAAKAFHWLFTVASALALWRLASRFASGRGATWAVAIFLAIPSGFLVSTWAYVEMAGIYFLLLAWGASFEERRGVRSELWAGLLIGLACGTKYTFLLPGVGLGLYFAARARTDWWRAGLAFLASATFGGSFWYLRNWFELGNPVFPFLYSWFGGEGWDAERAQIFSGFLHNWGQGEGWRLWWSLTFESRFFSISDFDGVVGPVFWLGAPLVLIAAWYKAKTRSTLILALFLLVTWSQTTLQVRFLLPTLAIFAALIPAGVEVFDRRVARALGGVVAAGVLLALSSHAILWTDRAPLAYAFGLESADEARARNLPGSDYEVFRRIPEVVPANGRIFVAAAGNPMFLCPRPYYSDAVIENYTLRKTIAEAATPTRFVEALRGDGFTHMLFRFDLVFGASDLELSEKQFLADALAKHATLEVSDGGTLLYRLEGR